MEKTFADNFTENRNRFVRKGLKPAMAALRNNDTALADKIRRGVAIFAKACFGHPSPSKQQKLNATANAFGAPDVLRTCHFATTIVNSVLAS